MLDWVQSSLAAIEFLPEWLTTALSYLAGFLTFLLSIILIGLLGGSVVLCALSPVFSVLAEKSFSALTGEKTKNNMKQLLVSIGRGLSVSLYNLFWQLLLLTTLFIASFIPIVGFVTPFLMLMVNAYFFGSSMTDYSMELHKMKLRESLNFASHNKGLMMGIGLPFAMAVCVPWVGTYVALLVSPAVAVAGARAMVLRRSDNLPQG